jgi:hypothetical protein
MRKRLILLCSLLLTPAWPVDGDGLDFDRLVGDLERHYGKRRLHVPFLGLASFVGSGLARPLGASSLKLAIIEDVDRSRPFAPRLGGAWRPVIRVSRRGEESTAIFGLDEGKWVKLVTLVQDGDQAVVMQFRLRPSQLLEYIARQARD